MTPVILCGDCSARNNPSWIFLVQNGPHVFGWVTRDPHNQGWILWYDRHEVMLLPMNSEAISEKHGTEIPSSVTLCLLKTLRIMVEKAPYGLTF